ncbi:ABC transporter substrate-binding protein [Marinobacterium lutimaris]|uniref:Iron complex transport system substrate-binding protein n=1 Tax=Marinobacterium lutimaris TaxID=568106 RepID=A0A1H6AGP0_9GAMM|nr:ABC transporter substrate-binding protein [Marinobacterium lutimaris]SEG47671.1 iron complex transport system substrate-binding protein [Marinobacterium lutimaris]
MSLKSLIPSLRQITGVAALGGLLAAQGAVADVTLETRYGSVSVNDDVKRVVTLYEGALDAAVAVDVIPVGAITTRGGDGVASYIQDKVEGIEIVGTARETNLESVIALQPDLILASSRLPKEQYDLLSSVAPTLVPTFDLFEEDAWKKESLYFARALNRVAEMEQVLAETDQRGAQVQEKLNQTLSGSSHQATLARWMPQGALVMSDQLFAGSLLAAAGFDMKDAGIIEEGRPHSEPLSQEKLSLIDGDWLFLATLNDDGDAALDAARKSAAFQRLDVVKNDHVIPVDGQLFSSASGPLAANAIFDKLETVIDQAAQ